MAIIMNMLAKPGAVKTLTEARELLKDLTPLKINCGKICGGACCQPSPDDDGENGMLLFPFEESFYKEPIEGFPFHLADDDTLFKGGKRLVCEGKCVREHRPLACRIFPLRMKVETNTETEEVKVSAEIDPRAWCVCPLLEQGGLRAMQTAFIDAVAQAGQKLSENVYMLEAMLNEQRFIDEMRKL